MTAWQHISPEVTEGF